VEAIYGRHFGSYSAPGQTLLLWMVKMRRSIHARQRCIAGLRVAHASAEHLVNVGSPCPASGSSVPHLDHGFIPLIGNPDSVISNVLRVPFCPLIIHLVLYEAVPLPFSPFPKHSVSYCSNPRQPLSNSLVSSIHPLTSTSRPPPAPMAEQQLNPNLGAEKDFGQTTGLATAPNGTNNNPNAHVRATHPRDYHNPMAFIHEDSDRRLPAFGGEFQPGLYRSVEARKFANPAPLGLSAFALTTFVLSAVNLNVRGVSAPNIAVPLALGYGGLVQLLAGMW